MYCYIIITLNIMEDKMVIQHNMSAMIASNSNEKNVKGLKKGQRSFQPVIR